MSTVAKLFNSILNRRIVNFLEKENILSEEQNGFRRFRSCLGHIYTLCTILRNRKTLKLDTFLCFVDFSKALDSVDHTFLWHKLMAVGIHGRILKAMNNMYSGLKSCLRINDTFADWFSIDKGV